MLKTSAGMASVAVRSGLGPQTLAEGAVYIVGGKAEVQKLAFEKVSPKLAGLVSAEDFVKLKAGLDKAETVGFGGNWGRLVGTPGKVSRHECPSEPLLLARHVRSALSAGADSASLVLCAPKARLLASVAALARAFPLFSLKTAKAQPKSVSIELLVSEGESLSETEVEVLAQTARSVREAAALVDMPCSLLNTDTMTAEAKLVAEETGAKLTVIRGEELREGGFGGLYSVGRAAAFPPALVVLSHTPAGADSTLALVGKGIVYDTGGMSLKTKTGMPGMKRDMGGAAAVLMGFRAAVKAGYSANLHALLCLAENHIGNMATKPDDVITMLSGKTVEVNNTDAEGRLVLGDGVVYAQKVLKADTVVDLATLTGAQATATGIHHSAIVSNSDEWEARALKVGRACGDMASPLPYAPNLHMDILSSAIADMKNSGLGKSGDAASAVAALFIGAQMGFPDPPALHWLHVDMAAPVHLGERATGYGPTLILALLAPKCPKDLLPLLNPGQ